MGMWLVLQAFGRRKPELSLAGESPGGIPKVTTIHPVGNMNVCGTFHAKVHPLNVKTLHLDPNISACSKETIKRMRGSLMSLGYILWETWKPVCQILSTV